MNNKKKITTVILLMAMVITLGSAVVARKMQRGNEEVNTGDMIDAFLSTGQFEWIPGCPDGGNLTAGDGSPLQPGDVLLTPGSHTEMYIGNGRNVGAHSNYDGAHGDSSGSEINVQDYSQGRQNWDGVLRYKGA